MAVIDEYYNSRLDLGPPAAVAYLAGFMGERERMNRAIIDQMLAASDPRALAEAERDAQKAKNDLLKLKAQMSTAERKSDVALLGHLLGYRGVERSAQSREAVAGISARAMLARAYTNDEDYRQKQIQQGEDAIKGNMGAIAPAGPGTADDQARQYVAGIEAAKTASGADKGALRGEGLKAAEAVAAQKAYETAMNAGHTGAADVIKRRYFNGEDPAAFRDARFRRKTEAEIDARVKSAPLGGASGNRDIAALLASDAGVTPEQMQELIYGALERDLGGRPEGAPRLSGDELAAAGVAAIGGAPSAGRAGAVTPEIDDAIAQIDEQIKSLRAQRGRSPSLQEIAASRYPNYLYANPFQVRSRAFDQFAREVGEMSPQAGARYVSAFADARGPFPGRQAIRELERTERIAEPGGIDFSGEGVQLEDKPAGAFVGLNAALEKAVKMQTDGVTLADGSKATVKGDTVTVTKGGKTSTYKKGTKEYGQTLTAVRQKVDAESGLTAAYDALPDDFASTALQGPLAALGSGGYEGMRAELQAATKANGEPALADVYADALEAATRAPDAAKAVYDLLDKAPADAPWAAGLKRAAELSPEAALQSVRSWTDTYGREKERAASGEGTVSGVREAERRQLEREEMADYLSIPGAREKLPSAARAELDAEDAKKAEAEKKAREAEVARMKRLGFEEDDLAPPAAKPSAGPADRRSAMEELDALRTVRKRATDILSSAERLGAEDRLLVEERLRQIDQRIRSAAERYPGGLAEAVRFLRGQPEPAPLTEVRREAATGAQAAGPAVASLPATASREKEVDTGYRRKDTSRVSADTDAADVRGSEDLLVEGMPPAVLPAEARAAAEPLIMTPDSLAGGYMTGAGVEPVVPGMRASAPARGKEEVPADDATVAAMPAKATPAPAKPAAKATPAPAKPAAKVTPAPAKPAAKVTPAPAKPAAKSTPAPAAKPAAKTAPAKKGPTQAELDAALRAMDEE